ncbi:kinase-like domain-containing protein [Mortierella sp. GBAus27b]|nr:hypothetical protein BGX31_002593 [Mortierella sp. GBA43]KAI8345001.1 kinase-like domain-containing protein [Mortierella sp. GBAus27b]
MASHSDYTPISPSDVTDRKDIEGGQGLYAKVRKGMYKNGPVAIKTKAEKKSTQKQDPQIQLNNESAILRQLRNQPIPHIAKYIGEHREGNKPDTTELYLEFVNGKTLDAAMATLELKDKKQIFKDLLKILNDLHTHKLQIIHGDLHEGNVMLDDKNKVACVIDFGNAKMSAAAKDKDNDMSQFYLFATDLSRGLENDAVEDVLERCGNGITAGEALKLLEKW